jgi:hypothetical protein
MRGFIDRRMRYSDVVVIMVVVVDIKGIMIEEGGVVAGVDVVVDVVVMEVDIKVIGKITTLMTTASSGSGSSGSSKKMDLVGWGLVGIGSGREMRGEEGSEGGGCCCCCCL